jgi:hypothetical protein
MSATQVETQLQDIADRIDEIVTILKEMRAAAKETEGRLENAETRGRDLSVAQN